MKVKSHWALLITHIETIGGYYLPEITSVYILAFIRRNSRFTTKTQYPDPDT